MIYIASPFFNEEQIELVSAIENFCKSYSALFFSPRLEGATLKDKQSAEREQLAKGIYSSNVNGIKKCDSVIAVIDGFDPGTIFEIGYAAAIDKKIYTLTAKKYGLNVMLSQCVSAHTDSPEQAVRACLGKQHICHVVETVT